ncbi:MAG: Nif3-like dinuclear metal center hexameric protein [Planctomycetota bacterium]|jgi:dinuclear metal center YbgI/SA1388 family protein
MTVSDIVNFLEGFAPPELAEDWDNTGLLVGADDAEVSSIMTCLTLTPDVAAEAIEKQAGLIVTHHPILFRGVQQITGRSSEGQMLLDLIRAGIAVYSPHTSYDSALAGINQQLAEMLELSDIKSLRPIGEPGTEPSLGSGRYGDLSAATTLGDLIDRVKPIVNVEQTWYVGDLTKSIRRVGIACGSAAEFMRDAAALDCDVLLTGEARFHACLEARTLDIALILPGHYATERPAMENLAQRLTTEFPSLPVWASKTERDPLSWT